MPGPFSDASIAKGIEAAEARAGTDLEVGLEVGADGKPALEGSVQGGGERVSWVVWGKTQFSKATTAVGAKLGINLGKR